MTNIKICGMTNLADALAATQAGADLLGFIFYEPSPRSIDPKTAGQIVETIRRQEGPESPRFVGVFVNETLETVREILDGCRLDAVQLHGEEPPAFVEYFQGRAFKAMRPRSQPEAEELVRSYSSPAFQPNPPASLPILGEAGGSEDEGAPTFLIDAYHPERYGGTGRVADWTMAAAIARRYPIMLAGSLTPENVAAAIEAVRPWGVDVSSGVEAQKGKKDHAKMRAFVKAVKGSGGAEEQGAEEFF